MSQHTICLILFIVVSVCWGKKIIVPDNFYSINVALAESDEGDTVYVKNGVYTENIVLAYNITLLGENKYKTIIKGDRRHPVIIGENCSMIKNVTITNGSVGILCVSTVPIITGNIIRNNRNAGIHAISCLPEIADNQIQDNGQFGIFLHWVQGCNTSIHGNTIADHSHSGIYCYKYTDVLIVQNIMVRNRHYGVFARDSRNSRIFDNTFYQNKFPFNQLAICDDNNRLAESLDNSAKRLEQNDIQHSYYGVFGTCNSFNYEARHIPVDHDYFNSYFFRRHSEKLFERSMCGNDAIIYGINSYQKAQYWDAAIYFGKSLTHYPHYPLNPKALYLMANSFMQLGLLQCAKNALDLGLATFPTSSYPVLYYLTFLRIAFLEENQEKIEFYYAQLQNYCLNDNIQNECNRIRRLSAEFKNNVKDTLIKPEGNANELAEFESIIFTNVMSKPTSKIMESLTDYQEQYNQKYRTWFKQLYSSKIAELDFNVDFLH